MKPSDRMRPNPHPRTRIDDSGNDEYKGRRLLIGTPTTGLVRMEWVASRYNQFIPTNWSKTDVIEYMSSYVPLRYTVHDAQNLIVKACLEEKFEWLLLVEHDTMPPANALFQFTRYMDKGDYPIVSGLYFTKSDPPEPMVYRGRGTHYFDKWKMSDKVWVDGVPTGLVLIHSKLLKAVWDDSPEYIVPFNNKITRRVFDSPNETWFNEETGAQETLVGTSDLDFCTRIINNDYLAKTGFNKVASMKYPFLIDTNIFAMHIREDGVQFPQAIPKEFAPPENYKPREIK